MRTTSSLEPHWLDQHRRQKGCSPCQLTENNSLRKHFILNNAGLPAGNFLNYESGSSAVEEGALG